MADRRRICWNGRATPHDLDDSTTGEDAGIERQITW